MHVLYVDESICKTQTKTHLILAGICVFERQIPWLDKPLNAIAARFTSGNPRDIELHGNPMYRGKEFWKKIEIPDRVQAIKDALTVLADSHKSNRVFAVSKELEGHAPKAGDIDKPFLHLATQFDDYLKTQFPKDNSKERGIVIFDKSKHEKTIQTLTTRYRDEGHKQGTLQNLAEVPLFLDSKASRIIQLADLVAYAMNRHLRSDSQFFEIIKARFDKDEANKNHALRTY